MNAKRILFAFFLISLWLPLIAVSLSPRFSSVASNLVHRTGDWDAEKEVLRRTTPLWNGAVSMYNTLAYRMGASGNRAIAQVGKDGWVFLGDVFNRNFSQAIGRRQLNEADLSSWSSSWRGQADYLKSQGIAFVVIVAPSQWSIYRDKLPAWAPDGKGHTPLDQLLALSPKLPLLDLRPTLIAGRAQHDTYSKLNSHWTDYGAFVAWPTLAAELERQTGERLWRPQLERVEITDEANEFDGMMSIRARNPWTRYVLNNRPADYQMIQADGGRQAVQWDMKTSLFDMPRRTWNMQAPSAKRLLVLRDSMGDALSPFLQNSFRDVVQLRHSLDTPATRPDFVATIEQVKPDVVIVELTERYLDAQPPSGMYWRLARAFFHADAKELARWQAGGGQPHSVKLGGDSSLRTAALSLELSQVARKRTHSSILRADVQASGTGRLRFVIKCAGRAERTQSIAYRDGNNVLLFELESQDCGTLSLAREPSSADAIVSSLEIRQL